MILNKKNEPTIRLLFRTKFGIVLTLGLLVVLLCLLVSTSQAQSRLTYGLEAGLGSSQLITGISGSSETIITSQTDHYAQMIFENAGGATAVQLGGYARYYWTKVLFVQSGLSYGSYGGSVNFLTQSFLPADLPLEHGWQPGYQSDYFSVRHRYHQLEVPLLLGVRIARQLRLYAGPALGLSVYTGTQTDIPDEYRWSPDPFFGNLRLGIGADMERLSLDIHYQETFTYNSSTLSTDRSLPDYFLRPAVSADYNISALQSVVVKVGYRLQ